jgi:hypothetical protein
MLFQLMCALQFHVLSLSMRLNSFMFRSSRVRNNNHVTILLTRLQIARALPSLLYTCPSTKIQVWPGARRNFQIQGCSVVASAASPYFLSSAPHSKQGQQLVHLRVTRDGLRPLAATGLAGYSPRTTALPRGNLTTFLCNHIQDGVSLGYHGE